MLSFIHIFYVTIPRIPDIVLLQKYVMLCQNTGLQSNVGCPVMF